jgi:hypothetical protein
LATDKHKFSFHVNETNDILRRTSPLRQRRIGLITVIQFSSHQLLFLNIGKMSIEVFKIVYKLAERFKTEEDRFWKLIVELFVVEGIQSVQLGNLSPKFEAYYGRKTKYTGRMRQLVSLPEFQNICKIVQIDSTVNIEPSDSVKLITQGLAGIGSVVNQATNNSPNYKNNNSMMNTNIVIDESLEPKLENESLVHPDLGAVMTIRGQEINPNNPFLERARQSEEVQAYTNTNNIWSTSQNNPFVTLAHQEKNILKILDNVKSDNIPNNMNVIDSINQVEERESNKASESEKFGSMMLEELTCLFCMEILRQPVETSCCKALCCLECTEKIVKMRKVRNSCPVCRAEQIQWSPNEPLRRLLAKKPTKCDIEGCNVWSTLDEISQHKATCEFRLVNCENVENGCPHKTIAKLLAEHVRTCHYQIIPCPHCETKFLRQELNSHDVSCKLKPFSCTLCQRMFPKKDLAAHTHNCEYKRIKCKNGCIEPILLKDVQRHELEECPLRRIHCPNQGCKLRDFVPKIENHLLQCPHRVIQCYHKGCNTYLTAQQLNDHTRICKFRLVNCNNNNCKQQVPLNGMNKHLGTECNYRLVKCQYDGCNTWEPFATIKTHETQCSFKPRRCPFGCGAIFTAANMPAHTQQCNYRKVLCSIPGCNLHVEFHALAQHVEHCPFALQKCPNEGCPESPYNRDLELHKKRCNFRIVPCTLVGCEKMMLLADLEQHEKTCRYRKHPCPNPGCNKQFTKKELYVHAKTCKFTQVSCPNEGCPFTALDAEIPKHLHICKYRETKCRHKGCGASVKKIDLEKHQEECQYALWNCRNEGCSVV